MDIDDAYELATTLDRLPSPVRERLLCYRPTGVPADRYAAWSPSLLLLAAAYGPASATEAKVTMTALCQLLRHVGPELQPTHLSGLLNEGTIGTLRAELLSAATNEGTVNNRIGRLNQVLAVHRGLPRTHKRGRATSLEQSDRTAPYCKEELDALRVAATSSSSLALVLEAGIEAGLVVSDLIGQVWKGTPVTDETWDCARRAAAEHGLALIGTRLRATWRADLLAQPHPFVETARRFRLTTTDLEHVTPAAPSWVASHVDALRG
ncbi:MAG: hypothetical protein U0S36_04560 [Candidatus Nanopelagicales bacterium]